MTTSRRQFLASLTAGAAALTAPAEGHSGTLTQINPLATKPIACNSYTWNTFYARAGKQWMKNPDESLSDFARSGFTAYEPAIDSVDQLRELGPLLTKYALSMPSIYVNSSLHRSTEVAASIKAALAIADAAKTLGTRIVVTNPNPIKWGSPENKSDGELIEQVRNLNLLGSELRKRNMTLAYHTHAPEHRAAAREFHHMMLGSDPANVKLCLDAHWVYRGSENSQVALFDVVRLYGKRIAELHVRQSVAGIWSEVFTPTGDIDYNRLVTELKAQQVQPLIVMEQCLEAGSPNTMDGVAAHRLDAAAASALFG